MANLKKENTLTYLCSWLSVSFAVYSQAYSFGSHVLCLEQINMIIIFCQIWARAMRSANVIGALETWQSQVIQ